MNAAASWLAAGVVAVLTHGAAVASLGTLRLSSVADQAQSPPTVRVAVNLVPPPPEETAPAVQRSQSRPVVTESPATVPQEPVSAPAVGATRDLSVLPAVPVLAAHRADAPAVVPPRALAQPRPRYPLAARRKGVEGTVRCRVEVSAAGKLIAIDLVETSGHKSLDRAAIRALEETPFASAETAGRRVAGSLTVAVRFVLN